MNDDTLAKAQLLKRKIAALQELHDSWWSETPPAAHLGGSFDPIEVDAQVWADAAHAICANIATKRDALQAEFDAL